MLDVFASSLADLLDNDARIEAWREDGRAWCVERLDEHVWSKQDEILTAVREHRRTAVRSCHGVGKAISPLG